MKYMIAVKPCGCPSGGFCATTAIAEVVSVYRSDMEEMGYTVCESSDVPEQRVVDGCPHGSLPAQLAAKLREAEAREAGLKEWLQRRACAVEFARGISGNTPLADQFQGKLEAFREVLTKLEGNGQWEGSKQ